MEHTLGADQRRQPTSTALETLAPIKKHWHRSEGHVDFPSGDTDHHDTQEHMLLLMGGRRSRACRDNAFSVDLPFSSSVITLYSRCCHAGLLGKWRTSDKIESAAQ